MGYLGFVINSLKMNLSLTVLQRYASEKTTWVTNQAKITGKLTSSVQGILPTPLGS